MSLNEHLHNSRIFIPSQFTLTKDHPTRCKTHCHVFDNIQYLTKKLTTHKAPFVHSRIVSKRTADTTQSCPETQHNVHENQNYIRL